MEHNSEILKCTLSYLICSDYKLCRLCLTQITDEIVRLQDVVNIKKPYCNICLTYSELFADLGVEQEPLLPDTICVSCATTVANAYMFKQLSQYYNNRWNEVLTKLIDAIDMTRTLSESVKTVFVLTADDKNVLLTSRSYTQDKDEGLIKMKEIMRYKKRYEQKKPAEVICEECGENFKSSHRLLKHITKVHKQVRVPCTKCPRTFLSNALLAAHNVKVHHPKKFKCPKCDKMFSTKNLLSYHDNDCHMAVLCTLCFVQFPSKRELRSHMNKHDANSCPKCDKTFYNKKTYKTHLKICGDLFHKQIKYFCDICNKGYAQKPALRSHLKIDHGFGVNLHHCKYCDKKYDAASSLRNHMVVHTRERNFTCEECGNKFVTAPALLYHTRLHTGERPYKCDMCDESFVSASRRMEHKDRKHFGPKQCPICHSEFVLHKTLKRHMKKHADPRSKLFMPSKI